jgi:hypothetical protein
MLEKLEKANELLKVQGSTGNWDHDNYMTGMYNGMELIVSLFEERDPVYKDCLETAELVKKVTRESLVEDYLRRFDDIKFITFSEKKGTTTVVLKDGVVGTVVPCSKDEVIDVRVGILEAYVKALKNSEIITRFCERHKLYDYDLKVKGNTITLYYGYSFSEVHKFNTELSLLENLNNAWQQHKDKEQEKKISNAIQKLIKE